MYLPHIRLSLHIIFYRQSLFEMALATQKGKLCVLSLLRMNPGFGDSEHQIIGAKRDRVNGKRKNMFRSKRKTSNKWPAASHKDKDRHSAVCSSHLRGSCGCLTTSKEHVVASHFSKWISDLITKVTSKPRGKFTNSEHCSEGCISARDHNMCVRGEANCNLLW